MTENAARMIDAGCKTIATLALLFGGVWTYFTWADATAQEARKPFLEHRLEIYIDTVRAVSTIATTNDSQEGDKARAQFWVQYHGPMLLVQKPETATAMEEIAECLRQRCAETKLRSLLPDLVSAFQKSIREEWKVQLAPGNGKFLPDEKPQ